MRDKDGETRPSGKPWATASRSAQCWTCGKWWAAGRRDAITCSAACRKARQRIRRQVDDLMRHLDTTSAPATTGD